MDIRHARRSSAVALVMPRRANRENTIPNSPPAKASSKLSTNSCDASLPRPAPTALALRTRTYATLPAPTTGGNIAHAIRSTNVTVRIASTALSAPQQQLLLQRNHWVGLPCLISSIQDARPRTDDSTQRVLQLLAAVILATPTARREPAVAGLGDVLRRRGTHTSIPEWGN